VSTAAFDNASVGAGTIVEEGVRLGWRYLERGARGRPGLAEELDAAGVAGPQGGLDGHVEQAARRQELGRRVPRTRRVSCRRCPTPDPSPVFVPVLMRELGNSPRGVPPGGA
jgi:hypothetical protein